MAKLLRVLHAGWSVVDDAIYDLVAKDKWRYCNKAVIRGLRRGGRGEPYKTIRLAHVVLPGHKLIDHINRNPLDNRRDNLRPASRLLNMLNSKISSKNASGFKNVYWHKRESKWVAALNRTINGKPKLHYLGYYDNKLDAAKAVETFLKSEGIYEP